MSVSAFPLLRLSRAMTAIPADAPAPSRAEHDAWLARLVEGEAAALEQLYRDHHVRVRLLVRRFLADAAAVEDVVHDTFLAAPSAFANYRGEGSVRSFLFSVAVRQVHHHLRSLQRRRGWLGLFRADPSFEQAAAPTPAEQTERSELAARLEHAIAALSFEHRAVVVLCELEELSSPEAAAVLQIPEGTVRTRLHHAKKRLRELLADVRPNGATP